jgi:hypothetical protein
VVVTDFAYLVGIMCMQHHHPTLRWMSVAYAHNNYIMHTSVVS